MIDPNAHTAIAGYGVLGASRPTKGSNRPKAGGSNRPKAGRSEPVKAGALTVLKSASDAASAFKNLSNIPDTATIAQIKQNPVVQSTLALGLKWAAAVTALKLAELQKQNLERELSKTNGGVEKKLKDLLKDMQLLGSKITQHPAVVAYENFLKRWKVAQGMFPAYPSYPVVGESSPKTKGMLEKFADYDKDDHGTLQYFKYPKYDAINTASAAFTTVTKGKRFVPPAGITIVDYYEYKGKGDGLHPNTKGEIFHYNGTLSPAWAAFVSQSAAFLETYNLAMSLKKEYDGLKVQEQKLGYAIDAVSNKIKQLQATVKDAKALYEKALNNIKGNKARDFITTVIDAAIKQGKISALTKNRELLDKLIDEQLASAEAKEAEANALLAQAEAMEDGPEKEAVISKAMALLNGAASNRSQGGTRSNKSLEHGQERQQRANDVQKSLSEATARLGDRDEEGNIVPGGEVNLPSEQEEQLKKDLALKAEYDKKIAEQQKKLKELGEKVKALLDKAKELSEDESTSAQADEVEEQVDENLEDLGDEEAKFPWALLLGAAATAAQFLG